MLHKKEKLEKVEIDLSKFKIQNSVHHEYQQLGLEMQHFYPVKERGWLWSLFWKHKVSDIREAHAICVEKNKASVRYLIGIINRRYGK